MCEFSCGCGFGQQREVASIHRLESTLPSLVTKLCHASTGKQRAAALVACKFALSRAQVEDAGVEKGL
jgi:hypothetical protein